MKEEKEEVEWRKARREESGIKEGRKWNGIKKGRKDASGSALYSRGGDNDVQVFAVSATDGLLDFMEIDDIAQTVAKSLYVDNAPHPLSACESLITTAATSWHQAKEGRYRDDIAIAVSKLTI